MRGDGNERLRSRLLTSLVQGDSLGCAERVSASAAVVAVGRVISQNHCENTCGEETIKKFAIFVMMGGMVVGGSAFADTCSNQTISNKTLHQLEVTAGTCILNLVTVHGGLTVDGGAHLQLTNSTVDGGINVQPNGELDLQATTNGAGQPIPGSSTVNGGIVVNTPFDLDLRDSKINGGVSIAGPKTVGGSLSLCNLEIRGGVTLTNVTTSPGVDIGAVILGIIPCSGSTIDGSVTIDHSVAFAVSNTTISGSLRCINGGVVTNHTGDNITGSNSCF